MIESGATLGTLRTYPIQKDFGSKVLPATKLGFESPSGSMIAIGTRPSSSGGQENESLWGAQFTLGTCRQRQRQVLYLLCTHDSTDIRRLRLQRRGIGHHRHGLFCLTDLHGDFEGTNAVDLDDDASAFRGLEAGSGDFDVVGAQFHIQNAISTG